MCTIGSIIISLSAPMFAGLAIYLRHGRQADLWALIQQWSTRPRATCLLLAVQIPWFFTRMNWEKREKMPSSSALITCITTMLSDIFVGALGVKFLLNQARTPADQYGPDVDFTDLGYGRIPKNYPGMQRGAVALLTAADPEVVFEPQELQLFRQKGDEVSARLAGSLRAVDMERKRIAIVGSGVSGIGALYALRDTPHKVHLYEAADRLGGHTNTVPFEHNGNKAMVDTGFIVMNAATCPNFIPFLNEIGVETVPTEMTFGISRDNGSFKWAGTSVNAIFAQRANLFRPSIWRMIFDIVRFNQFALDLLSSEDKTSESATDLSIGEYLDREGYSSAFRDDHLIPMTAAVWSTGPDKCALEFPAVTLVRFLWNHHLLSTIATRPEWRTIKGGTKKYMDAVMRDFPPKGVHLSTPVQSVTNDDIGRVVLDLLNGHDQAYDIISTSATAVEKEIMSSFHTTPNTAYLHPDLFVSLPPLPRLTQKPQNPRTPANPTPAHAPSRHHLVLLELPHPLHPLPPQQRALTTVTLTYNTNTLQQLPVSSYRHILITPNPPHPAAAALTQGRYEYTHPLYNAAAVQAQGRLEEIQGSRGVWYCSAWTGYGFHEDRSASG
ncbi:hypothetical protein H2201_005570 [Coniosporium apollinis]|uniref:Amine oxidase domain-containing protein n=1 Tax=Coniosporium apollinis TaxID=61459 RepID=A0ABQ9NRT2_9PEZI|nr:hypothetical protein H2201_005570 [Coniosporium apollinis]